MKTNPVITIANSGNPSAYPIYFSFPYTDRNYGEENPILFSGLSCEKI